MVQLTNLRQRFVNYLLVTPGSNKESNKEYSKK